LEGGRIILVTGGTGFIGSRITRNLLVRGEAVVVFDSRPMPSRLGEYQSHPDLRIVEGDITQLDDLLGALRTHAVERVIHTAALLGGPIEREPRLGVRVNVVGTTNVFEAARHLGVRRVVYASSMIVHGDQSDHGDVAVNEDSPLHPKSIYAYTKIMNEVIGAQYLAGLGVDCRGLRVCTPVGYGRDDRGAGGTVSRLIAAAVRGEHAEIPYSKAEKPPYVYVDDEAEIFVRLCLADGLTRPVYMSSATPASLEEIAAIVRRYLPEAAFTFSEAGGTIAHVNKIDGRRLEAELGYALPPIEVRIRDHINVVRAATGLPPLN
jgi:nucleoside-diphosphate-sugar epimerase